MRSHICSPFFRKRNRLITMHLPGCVNGGLVWLVALNLVLGSSISWEGVGVVLGNRSQRKNSATENHGRKHQYPKCFVVNYVLPVVIALLRFEMLDGHGLPPFQKVKRNATL
jgi:hypothetical protein